MTRNTYQAKMFDPKKHSRANQSASNRTTYTIVAMATIAITLCGLFGWLDISAGQAPLNLGQAVISGGVVISN